MERLQAITEADALAEGVVSDDGGERVHPIERYQAIWDSINADSGHGWATNLWAWVIAFGLTDA